MAVATAIFGACAAAAMPVSHAAEAASATADTMSAIFRCQACPIGIPIRDVRKHDSLFLGSAFVRLRWFRAWQIDATLNESGFMLFLRRSCEKNRRLLTGG